MNYENSLNNLESIIEKMETGQLTLEESLKAFEEGVKLAKTCHQALKKAEQKVKILTEKNGELCEEPFEVETN